MDALAEDEGSADRSYDGGLSRQTKALADAVDAFDASAVRADQIGDAKFLHLVGGPIDLRIGGREQVEPAYDGVHRNIRKRAARKRKDIDDAGVATAGDHDEALRSVEHQSLIFGNVVFDQPFRRANLASHAPVAFGKNAWHGPGKPCAGKYLCGGVVFDEVASGGFIGFLDGNHFVVFPAGFCGPAIEDSFRDVGARKSGGIHFH